MFNPTPHEQAALRDNRLGLILRPVVPQPKNGEVGHVGFTWESNGWHESPMLKGAVAIVSPGQPDASLLLRRQCPLGQPGDVLTVGEDWWATATGHAYENIGSVFYRADHDAPDIDHWQLADNMPDWAVRHRLRVVSVRCLRVQGLSEEDAIAAGARRFPSVSLGIPTANPCRWSANATPPTSTDQCLSTALWAIANVWNKTHEDTPLDYDRNPYVWAASVEP